MDRSHLSVRGRGAAYWLVKWQWLVGAVYVGHTILEGKAQPDLSLMQASTLIRALDGDFKVYLFFPPPLPWSSLSLQGSVFCPLPVPLHRGASQGTLTRYPSDGSTPDCTGFPLLPEKHPIPLQTIFLCSPPRSQPQAWPGHSLQLRALPQLVSSFGVQPHATLT